jgi:hypothetical protein
LPLVVVDKKYEIPLAAATSVNPPYEGFDANCRKAVIIIDLPQDYLKVSPPFDFESVFQKARQLRRRRNPLLSHS